MRCRPDQVLIDAVLEMKRRNPAWDCHRVAQQITLTFGAEIDKDVVRRILTIHYQLESIRPVRPGLPFSDTRKTVCRAAIYSAANRRH
jgi:hypothetical protein